MSNKEWGGTQFLNIVEQYEKEIVYFAQKLGLYDQIGTYFQEGLYGLWEAYNSYDPITGDFSAWAKPKIKYRMTNHLWQNEYRFQKNQLLSNMVQSVKKEVSTIDNSYHWSPIQQKLTVNQWKWLYDQVILRGLMHQAGEEEM
ncbi:sigma factor [Lentibacillus sp. CBA3610]|uniref:sigma factor n=1 Tax=Lentibacillus sp. CBA3610 TaxID=2518176 RepID=UPI0015950D42|nr:sigma factor [Lentibacillus sp. CBA3610]QKY69976.1 hypothetical protein Len3610_10580 [Lentibacillus sp. CBA3610]